MPLFLHQGAFPLLSLVPHILAPVTLVRAAVVNHGIDKLETIIATAHALGSDCGETLIDNRGIATVESSHAVRQAPKIKYHTSRRQTEKWHFADGLTDNSLSRALHQI